MYYEDHYSDFIKGQNARNEKNRHPERNRTTEDLLKNKMTCPEETIFQIGKEGEHISGEQLFHIADSFMKRFEGMFGDHVHILDFALHMDETTPHIHERHVFDCENKYGELCPQQEKALEALGIPLPDPDKPRGRGKNVQMTPVKTAAVVAKIPVFQPARLKEEGALEQIAAWKPDVIVVAAFGQILPKEVLSLPKYGCINIHASLLPKYRGASPIQQAILRGRKRPGYDYADG